MNFFSEKGRFRQHITYTYLQIHHLPPKNFYFFLRATNGESRYGTESKISLFLSSDSHWIPVCELRLQILLFSRRNSNGIRCGDRVKNFTFFKPQTKPKIGVAMAKNFYFFFQKSKASTRLSLSSFLLFFNTEKGQKTDFFEAKNGKFSNPKKSEKKTILDKNRCFMRPTGPQNRVFARD